MNMYDTLISFETAKLAKEKGFTNPVYWHYCLINNEWILRGNSFLVREQDVVMDKDEGKNGIEVSVEGDRLFRNYLWKDSIYLKASDCPFIAAPTQSLLQKWLRDEYNIDIIIIQIELNEYRSCSLTHSDITSIIDGDYTIYDFIDMSYSGSGVFEEALEKGLQEALKIIEL